MQDMQALLDRLVDQAAECAAVAAEATEKSKRDVFARPAEHFGLLAAQVENAMMRNAGHK